MNNRILSFIVVVLLLIVLIGTVSAFETYTSSTDTICNKVNGETVCTKKLYSGVRNVYEDEQWKRVEDACSLMDQGFTINILENDKDFPVEVVDFNLTSITVKLNPNGLSIFGEDVPIRIWQQDEIKSQQFNQDVHDGKKESNGLAEDYKEKYKNVLDEEVSFWLLNQEEERTFNFGMDSILEFGYNSTTILLDYSKDKNDANVRNDYPDTNYGSELNMIVKSSDGTDYRRAYISFDISSLLSLNSLHITEATLNLFSWTQPSQEPFINIHHVYNKEWVEESITWNNQPCGTNFDNSTACNLTIEDTTFIGTGGWDKFSIMNSLLNETLSSSNEINLALIEANETITSEYANIRSKETSIAESRPYLNITYTIPLSILITYPTNITYLTNVTFLNWTVGGDIEDYCWYSLDGGSSNISLTCGDLYTNLALADGSHTIDLWTNDTSGIEVWDNVTYFQDSIIPIPTISYPLNDSYTTNVTDLLYNFIETNPSYCWYSKDSGVSNSTLQACGTNWTNVGNSEGSNTLTLFINDTTANENQTDITFWMDTVGPIVNTAYPINTTYSSLSTFNYTYTEANPSYCWYSDDAGITNSSLETCGTNFTSMTTSEGQNTWYVFINDTSNNVNQSHIIFWVDSIIPVLNIEEPSEDFVWYGLDEDGNNSVLVDLNWTVSDTNLDACWYTNGTGAYTNVTVICEDNATTLIPYGTYNWGVFANDTLTNNEGQDTQITRYAALINNSHIGNTTTYETKTETFAVNVTYPAAEFTSISAVLHYDSLTYATTKTDTGDFAVFTKTMDMPTVGNEVINKSYFFNISLNNGTQFYYSTNPRNITVTPIIFQECNGTFLPFLNYTFKDEELNTFIDVSIPSSTFDFWLGNGDIKDSFSFSDVADTSSYAFCFSLNETIHTDIEFVYKQDPGYPQRTETYIGDLTNTTTFDVLYLTGTSNGAYITFKILDNTGTGVSDAQIQIERKINGAWTTISTDNSDDAGQVVFYLDITLDHRLTITHEDYTTEVLVIRPSQSVYTIILQLVGGEPSEYISPMGGITYTISPKPGPWLSENTIYPFTYNISANLSNLIFYSINVSLANGTELNSTWGTNNYGGNLTVTLNTTNYTKLYTYYYLDIGNGTYLIDPSLYIIHNITAGNGSIYSFFIYLASTETDIDKTYTNLFFLFFFFFLAMAAFTLFTGMELAQPGICMILMLFFVAICSITGYFTIDFAPSDFINKYGVLLVTFFLVGGHALGQASRT